MLRAVGTDLYEGDKKVILKGLNDTRALVYNLNVPNNVQWMNSNFPAWKDDTTTLLPSKDHIEFWHTYFWLCKHLGLNHVRIGGHNNWSNTVMERVLRTDPTHFDEVFRPMLDQAWANGIYLTVCLGGIDKIGGDKLNGISGEELVVDSPYYKQYVDYICTIINEYEGHPAIGIWDICNEPVTTETYNKYWKLRFPTDAERLAGYDAWAKRLVQDVRDKTNTKHLISIGMAMGGGVPPFEDYWTYGNFEVFGRYVDVYSDHMYFSAEGYEFAVSKRVENVKKLCKPLYIGECALNAKGGQYVPPYWWYWPWLQSMFDKYGVSCAWMTAHDMPSYPISDAIMASIPPVPSDVPPTPEPGPEPTELTIDVPPVVLGEVTVNSQEIVVPLPDVLVPGMNITLPGQLIKIGMWKTTLPAQTITIPAQVLKLGPVRVTVPAQKIVLPTLDIPAFEIEAPKG